MKRRINRNILLVIIWGVIMQSKEWALWKFPMKKWENILKNIELQVQWANGVRKYITENKGVYDPRKIISSGKENMTNKIKEIISLYDKTR